jgi:membrane protease YdiL (CAAX protease family)
MNDQVPRRPDLADLPAAPSAGADVQAVTWKWWEVLIVGVIGIFVASIVVFPLLAATDQDPSEPVGTTGLVLSALFDLVWVGVFVAWLTRFHRGWRRALGWPERSRALRETVIGAGLGIALYIGATIAGALITWLLSAVSGESVEAPVQVEAPNDVAGALVLVLMAVVVAAAAEEFIFRGLLFRSIADRRGFWPGAIVSALLFGLVHAAAGTDIAVWGLRATLVIVGVGLAWIYRWRRNLLSSIAAHAAFNAIGVTTILVVGTG